MKYNFNLQLDDRNSLTLIAKQIEKESVVLEFGPANGRLTHYLSEHKNCKVYAVEIDEDAAKDAAKYTEDIIVDDIEKFAWLDKWEDIEFDYILFADVLEHLRNPMEVLKQTKGLLKDDGKVILSVPNVAHNSIMIDLHRNIFSYRPVGLLDDTHIHLFSYYSLKEMCNYAGYHPVVEDAIYLNVGETEINNRYKDVPLNVEKVLRQKKYGNVYQFFFTLQKTAWVNNFDICTDYKIRTMAPGYKFQVFFDRGEGWMEENSVTISTKADGKEIFEVNIDKPDEVKSIRIDPLNSSVLIGTFKCTLVNRDETINIDLNKCLVNGIINKSSGEILFEGDDPQIEILNLSDYGKNIDKVRVEIDYVDCCLEKQLVSLYKKQIELEAELDRRLVELENRMDLINKLHGEIISLHKR